MCPLTCASRKICQVGFGQPRQTRGLLSELRAIKPPLGTRELARGKDSQDQKPRDPDRCVSSERFSVCNDYLVSLLSPITRREDPAMSLDVHRGFLVVMYCRKLAARPLNL